MDLKSIAEAYQSVQEKKLDPVGKEDGDVDNDGDKDSSDSYLMKRRAAIKKAMKKEEVEQIDELSKKTMGSYIAKGAKDLADRRFDQGDSEKRKYDPDEADDKEDKKLDKREQGIARAAKKMSEGMSAPRMQKGAMAYDGPNKAASEAKDRVMAKTKAKRKGPKPTVTIDKPDSLVSMKVSKGYKESFDALIESGKFSDLELQRFLFDAFEEGYQRNPEKDPQNKPYKEKSRAERMADPDRGINSPAFKKFMASQGM